jgi:hypothetical protein
MKTRLGRLLCALVTVHAFALVESACATPTDSSVPDPAADDPAAGADVGMMSPAAPAPSSAAAAKDAPGGAAAAAMPASSPAPAADPAAAKSPAPAPLPAACTGHIEVEPNDTKPEALVDMVCGQLTGADVDSFSLSVKEDARVSFALALSGGAAVSIDGAGVRLAPSAAELASPVTVRAKRAGTLVVTLSKPVASVSYALNVTRL